MKFTFLAPFLGPFLRQQKVSSPASVGDTSPVPQPEAVSKVLRGVLSDEETPDPEAKPRQSEFRPAPSPERLNVGAGLADAKRRVLEAAEELIALADTNTARTIASVARQLDGQTCCVAFVGQVKAGKSSLINVLVEQLDFLPADINPCTAVITRLYFGVPGKPQSGTLFTFFSREEWHRFSVGGRTRELTDRLFPDFDWEVFKNQVRAMEERAWKKHGPSLEDLLGKEHFYEEIRADSLVRYVGAEHPHPESAAEYTEGEFSDITKSADIFLDLGAFSFPTIVIDTPGVNDPFLVRDEITRQNLEAADVCVVVVTARHPLSAADLNLLRTLRGLNKDRLIVFINKIDELNGGEEILYEIRQRVISTLRQEFPASDIPVILGSAAFAHKGLSTHVGPLSPDGEDLPADDWEAAILQVPSEDEIAEIVEAETSFERSGLLTLSNTISDMISAGPAGDMVSDATSLIETVSRNLIAWLEIKADLLCRVSLEPGQVEEELGVIAALREELGARLNAFSEQLDAIHTQKTGVIKQRLSSAVEAFVPQVLASSANGDITAQAGQIDVKVRMRLETVFLEAIQEVRDSLANELEVFHAELSGRLEASGLNGNPAVILGQPIAFSPSLAPLSEPAALGLAAHLTKLGATPAYGDGGSADLAGLVVADFAPIVEKLAAEASRVLREEISSLVGQTGDLTFGPMDMVIEDVSLALPEAQTTPPGDPEQGLLAVHETMSQLRLILEPQ
jgi:GTP-binding protein EngB required for normal cell division